MTVQFCPIQGHAHAPNIKQWVEEVDETYKSFSTRMDQYREKVCINVDSVQFNS